MQRVCECASRADFSSARGSCGNRAGTANCRFTSARACSRCSSSSMFPASCCEGGGGVWGGAHGGHSGADAAHESRGGGKEVQQHDEAVDHAGCVHVDDTAAATSSIHRRHKGGRFVMQDVALGGDHDSGRQAGKVCLQVWVENGVAFEASALSWSGAQVAGPKVMHKLGG